MEKRAVKNEVKLWMTAVGACAFSTDFGAGKLDSRVLFSRFT